MCLFCVLRGVIEFVHIRFRAALKVQGQSANDLPFKALWYPYGTYAALAANIFLIFFQGYTAFLTPFSASSFVINYILLPVFVIMVVAWKFLKKTKWVKLEEMDIWTGRREDEADTSGDGLVNRGGKIGHLRRVKNVVIG